MDEFLTLLNTLSIAPWEAFFLAFLISVYVLMGLHKSGLIMTFGFIFYWGFKNFISVSYGFSERSHVPYGICGIVIIGLVSLNQFPKDFQRA